ncbi:MAG TPA: c-type cytochrome [Nitrosospira sp.]|nr:c-type cytochrome [Nitrosospira sp.]
MSSTEDEEEGHSSAIKTPGQLITVLVAAFVLPVVILLMIGRLAVGISSTDQEGPAFSDEAVARRLDPVGRLVIAGDSSDTQEEKAAQIASAPAPTSAPGAAPVADTGDPADKAKAIYAASCAACHTTGAAGAPKLGDTAAWAPRIKAGNETLYNSALKGKNAMPPKGGNASLSDAEVKAAVDYMVSQSK